MDSSKSDVWYLSYGSNMLFDRFKYYIEGGTYNDKVYAGCLNKTLPNKENIKSVIIKNNMYFGNCSKTWKNTGVCFLDDNTIDVSFGRMYLISENQFEEVHGFEGKGKNWYHDILNLGEYNGYPIKTFTNNKIREYNCPNKLYLDVLNKGIEESFPTLQNNYLYIIKYLVSKMSISKFNNDKEKIIYLRALINKYFPNLSKAERGNIISDILYQDTLNINEKIDVMSNYLDNSIEIETKKVLVLK